MIKILTVGKKHESWVELGISRYQKRLRKPWDIKWELVPHSSLKGVSARQTESSQLLARLKPDDHVILLDETGVLLDSMELAQYISAKMALAKPLTMIIGGSYGVSDELKKRADLVLSLSKLVFPHQLVRLIISEQLYRASQITESHPYHHQ